MSTRKGGVSTGECSSLNLGFNRNDERENVIANFNRICSSIGVDTGNLVFSNQIHDNRIKIIGESDKGKGFTVKSDIFGYDGLVTDIRGIALVNFFADCVPVFLYDFDKKVAALVHSGWRSTLKEISGEAVRTMKQNYNSDATSIIAAIGPSIGSCCFEAHEDVYSLFHEQFDNHFFYNDVGAGKWKIDLQGIIEYTLKKCGILPCNITQSGICTMCRRDLFFSHRGDNGRTGSLAAFMQLK
ncbi:MAG: peptidoglycan editing factor PgeF [Ruminiclostridium sp.]|nr:peptidoglycan editing factor PgeF [Ruminiclostridium sp.]